MKAIVTGGAGFIGSHIAERLLAEGHEVLIIDDLSSGYENNVPKGAEFVRASMSYSFMYRHLLKDVDVVFHNAASKKNVCLKDPQYDMEVNGIGTLKLLTLCVKYGVKKFVYASTGSVYGPVDGITTEESSLNPVSYYGVSKLAGDRYVHLFSDRLDITILRYFHVYGSRQEDDPELGGVVAVFKRQIEEGGPVTIHGTGNQKRSFTHVDDVVEANIQSWLNPISRGKVYNCASGLRISVAELAGMLINGSKKNILIEYLPPLEGDIYDFNIDNTKIREELGLKFKPFRP